MPFLVIPMVKYLLLIEADLQKAESLLQEQSDATFISKDFIIALRARMAAYRGQYNVAAASLAQELLDRVSYC